MGRDKALLIMDANVLIDLCEADRTLIRLISQHVGPIHVPLPVLQEVDQIDEAQCADLGILLVEPSLQTAIDAATHRRAGLSFNDHLCLPEQATAPRRRKPGP